MIWRIVCGYDACDTMSTNENLPFVVVFFAWILWKSNANTKLYIYAVRLIWAESQIKKNITKWNWKCYINPFENDGKLNKLKSSKLSTETVENRKHHIHVHYTHIK